VAKTAGRTGIRPWRIGTEAVRSASEIDVETGLLRPKRAANRRGSERKIACEGGGIGDNQPT
jgi:hypothetical protein